SGRGGGRRRWPRRPAAGGRRRRRRRPRLHATTSLDAPPTQNAAPRHGEVSPRLKRFSGLAVEGQLRERCSGVR
ncbi:MAG: hypothetical protein M3Y36_03925, partial [Actinomycetota bacterium]|nr:hypothetical protein [Actinomycetota bacterium]